MAQIEKSIDYVLKNEGGFTIDSGGPTMWGITIPPLAAFRKVPVTSITEEDIRHLTVAEATEVYKEQFWDRMNLDGVGSQSIATCIFDIGVNRGTKIGQIYAQKVCNLIGPHMLVLDGKIGHASLFAINSCPRTQFIKQYEALVVAGYHAIAEHNPAKFHKYLKGWLSRAERLLTLT